MNSCLILAIFLPTFVCGQFDSTVPPQDLEAQCKKEFNTFKSCMREQSLISKIGDIPLPDPAENLALAQEAQEIVNCSVAIEPKQKCPAAESFYNYLFQTVITLGTYYQHIDKTCLGNGTWEELKKICDSIPRPPEPVDDPCEQWHDRCVVRELRELKKCSEADFYRLEGFLYYMAPRCKMEIQDGKAWAKYLGLHIFGGPQ